MMSVPYIVGLSLPWYQEEVHIMLKKNPGEPKIHRLHIIALFENDFNHKQIIYFLRDSLDFEWKIVK